VSSSPGPEWQTIFATEKWARLDLFLSSQVKDLSREKARRLIEKGLVHLDGKTSRASQKVKDKARVDYCLEITPVQTALVAEDIPLDILFEDEELLVLNKAAGLVVHPGHGNWTGTLVQALLFHCGGKLGHAALSIGGEERPGIVHRIDKQTSGVLVVAKTDSSHALLSKQFKDHSIERRYQCLVWGKPPVKGEFTGAIARDPRDRQRMSVRENGRAALTRYKRLETFAVASYMEAELFTGRTHQIRVHFSQAGFPLVGDGTYATTSRGARKTQHADKLRLEKLMTGGLLQLDALTQANSRQMLHAAFLAFEHPKSKARLEFETKPPEDFQSVLKLFRSLTPPTR
jgi:23S rRNA pseudouridine1911/1915/1917 synthase